MDIYKAPAKEKAVTDLHTVVYSVDPTSHRLSTWPSSLPLAVVPGDTGIELWNQVLCGYLGTVPPHQQGSLGCHKQYLETKVKVRVKNKRVKG